MRRGIKGLAAATVAAALLVTGTALAAPITVTWTVPTEGGTVSGQLNEAANNCRVTAPGADKVSFYLDGVLLNQQDYAPWSCNWDTRTAADGSHHVLRAVAVNMNGDYGEASVNVTVDNGGAVGYPSLDRIDVDGDLDAGCNLTSGEGSWGSRYEELGGTVALGTVRVAEGNCSARFNNPATNDQTRAELGLGSGGPDPWVVQEMLVRVSPTENLHGFSTQTKQDAHCYNGGFSIQRPGRVPGNDHISYRVVPSCSGSERTFDVGTYPDDGRFFAVKVEERFSNSPTVGFIHIWLDPDGTGPAGYAERVPKTFGDNESADTGGNDVRFRIGDYRQPFDPPQATTTWIDGFHMKCVTTC